MTRGQVVALVAAVEAVLLVLVVGIVLGARGVPTGAGSGAGGTRLAAGNQAGADDTLEVAAANYIQGFPVALREAAKGIRGGTIKSQEECSKSIVDGRSGTRVAWVEALDASFAALVDSGGKITKPTQAAEVLEVAARAMEAKP